MTTKTKTKATAGNVASLPATDRVSEWRRGRASQRDELDAFTAKLDPTRADDEVSLAVLLARATATQADQTSPTASPQRCGRSSTPRSGKSARTRS